MDEKEDAERHFSLDSLRQLFQFQEGALCETHDSFKCARCKGGGLKNVKRAMLYGDASTCVVFFLRRAAADWRQVEPLYERRAEGEPRRLAARGGGNAWRIVRVPVYQPLMKARLADSDDDCFLSL